MLKDGSAVYTPGLSERRGSTSKFLHADAPGSTRGITDSSQSVTDSMLYDASGNVLSRTGTTPTPFGFVGSKQYQTDADSGLQLLGHRYYDPSVGRFLSSDPAKAGTNWYAYCTNNPLCQTDPTGLEPPTIGPGFTPEQQKQIQNMLDQIIGTQRGGEITGPGGPPVTIVPLEPERSPYTEIGQPVPIPQIPTPNKIHFDPGWRFPPGQGVPFFGFVPPFATPQPFIGQPAPTEILAHELGHAETGICDDGPGNMNNIIRNENPIGTEIGYPPRTGYGSVPSPIVYPVIPYR